MFWGFWLFLYDLCDWYLVPHGPMSECPLQFHGSPQNVCLGFPFASRAEHFIRIFPSLALTIKYYATVCFCFHEQECIVCKQNTDLDHRVECCSYKQRINKNSVRHCGCLFFVDISYDPQGIFSERAILF